MKCFVLSYKSKINYSNCPSSITFHVSPLLEWAWLTDGNSSICCFSLCLEYHLVWNKNRQCEASTLGSDHFVHWETELVKGALCDNLYKSLFPSLAIYNFNMTWKMRPPPCLSVAYTRLWMMSWTCLMLLDCGFLCERLWQSKECDFFSMPLSAHLTESTSGWLQFRNGVR